MEKKLPVRHSFRNPTMHRWLAVAAALVFLLVGNSSAWAQQTVAGTVTSSTGAPLRGVSVRVQGTTTRTLTDDKGRYSIAAAPDATLVFSLLGQRQLQAAVQNRNTVDVSMEPVTFLEEVVVTAYTEQRRADITGAVSSMNVDAANRTTGASVLQRLDATVPGITVDASGSPGSRSTVRIRGISSFQNNDPLYIVDGTPVQDSYINWLNPEDITSVQVLKDASSASIYGSRASNGVIIIETTKKGVQGPPRSTLRVRTGIATPVNGYDSFLIQNSLDYFEVVKRSYLNAGYTLAQIPVNIYGDPNNPQVPKYIWPNDCGTGGAPGVCTNPDTANYAYENSDRIIMPGSKGTNWWDAVFGPAMTGDYNLDVAGGGADNQYGVSMNYFDQNGTAAYNYFKRGSVRVNTSFQRMKVNFGENLAITHQQSSGGIADDSFGEGSILGKNIMMQPVVPVYDIRGNFASGKAQGLGNNTNPLKEAFEHRNDIFRESRIFGNVFAGVDPMESVRLQTRLGFNLAQSGFNGFSPITPENSEPTTINSINENTNQYTDWTWSNTANWAKHGEVHNFNLLLGQEANGINNHYIQGSMNALLNDDVNNRFIQDALGDAGSKTVFSTGYKSALLSFFGKADYNFEEKYMASFTVRQDGSSRLGPTHRWGTFPAVGLGWRLTKEPFMANNKLISDMLLRFGWGVTGNQLIPAGRIVSQYGGGLADTYYDVNGANSAVVAGYRQTSLGNPDLKWEENRSTNIGTDIALLDGRWNVVLDVYDRKTNNLLFDPPVPGTAGVASPPIVNIGKMDNKGVDVSLGYHGSGWNATLNGAHYKNKIVSIDGETDFFYGPNGERYGNPVINKVGYPIGAFYGLVNEGFFNSQAEADARSGTACGAPPKQPCQDGAAPGRIKFKDINGDGVVNLADRTVIGSPHPNFSGGLDLGYSRGNWDLSGTIFGTFGNDIFDTQKQWYVFRNFSTNVRKDLLTDSWTPTHTNAKYPILDQNDNFSHQFSDYYVEDGSYVRLRSLQLGYNIPPRFSRWTAASRVYLQAENLFTITGYDGLDPALPAIATTGPAGDIRDQYRGVDRGSYPSNKVFSIGLVTSF
ncbi:MAG TPA: SusC/RagA family TonB-linked outer membrane protein [Gemmatimonadaceae bacterium]|nr:SusC/RagA family TonB-linked outer membrane protein [Gemmatimonadaceae bacterium]